MKELLEKYREQISYLFFGGCTTLVNILVYYVFTREFSCDAMVGNVIAWILSVMFAYITNKIWVFESKTSVRSEFVKEVIAFFSCRGITLLLDMLIMFVAVKLLHFPDIVVKVLSNIIVILLNYILSKIYIFKANN